MKKNHNKRTQRRKTMTSYKMVCTGKFTITKRGDIRFEKEIDFICYDCMEDLLQTYIIKMNKEKVKKGKKQ